MNAEHSTVYNDMICRVNRMEETYIAWLVDIGCCPYEPEHLIGIAMGMFHCPLCGEMVVAGVHHPLPLHLITTTMLERNQR